MGFLKKIFGDYSSREIKRITPIKDKVLALEEEYSKLTDEQRAQIREALEDIRSEVARVARALDGADA